MAMVVTPSSNTYFGENSWKAAVQIIKAALAEAADLDVNEREVLRTELLKEITDLRDQLKDTVTDMIGEPGGFAPLDEAGQVPSKHLPSYVDDVIEGTLGEDGVFMSAPDPDDEESVAEAITPEKGKIYVDLNTNFSYRWSGSTYIKIESHDLVEITADDVQTMWDAITVAPTTPDTGDNETGSEESGSEDDTENPSGGDESNGAEEDESNT